MNNKLWMAVAGSALTLLSACSEPPQPEARTVVQPVKVITVGGEEALLAREFPATVRAAQRVTMAFQVPGRLVEFPVREGQQVTEGQQLGLLDDSDYQSNLNAAQADLSRTEANYNRAKELIEKNYVSQAEYDAIEANYNIAVSNVSKARKALNDTRMLAPFDGVVARTFVQNFEEVQAKEPVLSLQNNNELEVVVSVPESLVVRRNEGVEIQLEGTFEGIPGKTFALALKEFSTVASEDTQTFEYVLTIEETAGYNLLPGMTATVKVQQLASENLAQGPVVVPLSALASTEENQASVWLVKSGNRVSQQPVVTGELIGNSSITVLSGLSEGDQLVTAGVSRLSEGLEVKPIDKVEF
ncbi:efflux RND transporter periplasmic adaptor subunit [Marinobacter mobilis]|uniref:RND family efflux transporter, MFP subunit n=1 Tax=Marinobacter mobilis TaxID=488533 RepID=A0A1H2ZVG0_9GAMM|nr:efflux RND transporter periplasmic adaptor subunit [Marinobacter mobilis]SDX21580.1 RND family efflux transporter, MFP subunit [Marinobacter mobilis]